MISMRLAMILKWAHCTAIDGLGAAPRMFHVDSWRRDIMCWWVLMESLIARVGRSLETALGEHEGEYSEQEARRPLGLILR